MVQAPAALPPYNDPLGFGIPGQEFRHSPLGLRPAALDFDRNQIRPPREHEINLIRSLAPPKHLVPLLRRMGKQASPHRALDKVSPELGIF